MHHEACAHADHYRLDTAESVTRKWFSSCTVCLGLLNFKFGKVQQMDSVSRLQLTSRISYYAGWFFALCALLAHAGLGTTLFNALHLLRRNLLEGSVWLFLISMTSAVRALASSKPD